MLDQPSTPPNALSRARRIARVAGMRHAYTGNVHEAAEQSTYCHHCGQQLIGRDWFQLSALHLDAAGRCDACGTPCAGSNFHYGHAWWRDDAPGPTLP